MASALVDAYKALLLWTNSVSLALAAVGALFLLYNWSSPVVLLSQRWLLLSICLCVLVESSSYFAGSATTTECWINYLLAFASSACLFALLTAREFRLWWTYRSLQSQDGRRTSWKVAFLLPALFVSIVVLIEVLVTIFTWLLPFTELGIKPCQRGPNETVSTEMQAVANSPQYVMLVLHVVALIVSTVARNVPSICSDAYAIFIISLLGLVYVSLCIASYSATTLHSKTSLRIAYTSIQLVINILIMGCLIFKRGFYLSLSKAESVKRFMNIDLDVFMAIEYGYDNTAGGDSTFFTKNDMSRADALQRPESGYGSTARFVSVV
jgi:hypothetical protein